VRSRKRQEDFSVLTFPLSSSNTIPGRLELTIQSDPACIAGVRRAVEALAAASGMGDAGVGEVGLCVNEALANIIRHAYGGADGRPIVVAAYCQDGALVVTMRDWGNGVNPAALPAKPREELTPGGLGLICLRRMMTRVEFAPQADGMLLVMTKDLRDDRGMKTECGQ
jgi:anti-sigma regulatory factor (Ser/Thr protein kinase)